MASLYFRYGAMGSSKTANALMVAYNYKERGKNAILAKPSIDTRDGLNIIHSRIGLSQKCIPLEKICTGEICFKNVDAIIVDEAQFATEEQIYRLSDIVDFYNIPVICYGLRTDFKGNLFPGSQALMRYADKIECIKTVCWCGKAANFNARVIDGKIIKEGTQIVLGANESYVSLCRKHYKENKLK